MAQAPAHPTPAPILTAIADLEKTLKLDPLTASWSDVATAVTSQLGGDFDAKKAEHRRLSLSLGAVVGERLKRATNAFWFAQRDTFGASALGFPDVVFSVSPYSVATLALIGRNVAQLGEITAQIQSDHAAAKSKDPAPRALTPHDYHRFFDPGFVEFVAIDQKRAEQAWGMTPGALVGELKDAFFRAQLPRDGKAAVETQLITALQALDARTPLQDQAERAPRVVEQVAHLWAAVYGTGATTEDGWNNVAARLLVVGAPQSPAVLSEAIENAKKGQGAVTIWLKHVDAQPGAPKSGILGIFPESAFRAPAPKLKNVSLRLAAVDPSALLPLLQKYDATAIREAVKRYGVALEKAAGTKLKGSTQEVALLDEALSYLDKLRDTLAVAIKHQHLFCIRRMTESEAALGGKLGGLRAALKG